ERSSGSTYDLGNVSDSGSLSRYSKSTVRRHRRVSHFEVEFANSLNLNFSILEHNDGFKVQVIYASTQKALARISGDIAGVNKFYTIDDLTKDNIFLSIGKIVLWVFIGILAIAAIIGAIYVFKAVISKAFPNKLDAISKFIEKLLGYIFFGFFIIFIILVFGTKVYQFARSEALNSTPNMVSTEDIADKNNTPPK
ncbi:hypothetical protein K3H35_19105, partial [Aeromonas veronii]|uniref:hypothetical protein n=1 Tax=Aeromonas veronii TaxID=654 RepID=UPI001F3073B7